MKNKVWIIPSLVVFVLLISSKDISSQDLKDKVVMHTPNGEVTITSDNPLEDCARMIQESFEEELNGLPETDFGRISINCFVSFR